jgi:hypothetical protein
VTGVVNTYNPNGRKSNFGDQKDPGKKKREKKPIDIYSVAAEKYRLM